jgi:S-methylmethionine-dependent homocysteine/selenocysteine methylase
MTMDLIRTITNHKLVLTEAAVIETFRRSDRYTLHHRLENALFIYDDIGKMALSRRYQDFIAVAHRADVPIIISTPTWRANRERVAEEGRHLEVNGDAVRYLDGLRKKWGTWANRIGIGGLIGCKNDCYKPNEGLSIKDAKRFHGWQIDRLAAAEVDFLLAATLPAVPEAAGIALAMEKTAIPYLISFVIHRDGTVLDGSSLGKAFETIDALCSRPPLGYMINCAYPSFVNADSQPEVVLSRLIGYQANASSLDHSDLDCAENLHADDIQDWGRRLIELNKKYDVRILGGCCGTGANHLQYILDHVNAEHLAGERP